MVALIEAILGLLGILGILAAIFTPKGRALAADLLENLARGANTIAPGLMNDLSPALKSLAETISSAITNYGYPIAIDLAQGFQGFAKTMLDTQRGAIASAGLSTPENAEDTAAQAFTVAFGAGLSSAAVAALFESVFPEKLNTLNGVAPMLAQVAGFKQVAGHVIDPLYAAAFGVSLGYKYNSEFKPNAITEGEARQLLARRLLGVDDLATIYDYAGIKDRYRTALTNGAFRPLSPFLLARTIDDTNTDPTPMKALMQFSGYRDQDITVAIEAFQAAALKSLRQQVIAAAETNYVDGIASDQDLVDTLNSLNLSDDAKRLVELSASTKRLKVVAADYKKGWDAKAIAGEITAAEYQQGLSALGFTSPVIDALVDEIASKTSVAGFKAQAKAAAALQKQELAIAIRAAQTSFHEGQIDAAAFTAGLLVAGVSEPVAALYLALAEARGTVKVAQKKITLTTLQRLEVKADLEQYDKGLIDAPTLRASLIANGLTPEQADAEIEYYDAKGGKLSR